MAKILQFPQHKVKPTLNQWLKTRSKMSREDIAGHLYQTFALFPPTSKPSGVSLKEYAQSEINRVYPSE